MVNPGLVNQQVPVEAAPDPHSVPQFQVTHAQLTLFVAYVLLLSVWTIQFILSWVGLDLFGERFNRPRSSVDSSESGSVASTKDVVVNVQSAAGDSGGDRAVLLNGTPGGNSSQGQEAEVKVTRSKYPPPVSLDRFMTSMVMFGALLFYFYLCDYLKLFPQGERAYSRDMFLFLVFLFFLVASAYTITPNEDKILNRDQTEEWKGWMQVMFVWYHYFKAKEWYNWIRVYIACYVWMTGFGNFSFFWVRGDYSMWRLVKMLFRLNFLVIFVGLVTNNEYMLYYICAMHTYWFLTVYVFMRVLQSWNKQPRLMALKFAAYAVCNAIIFDIPGFSSVVFRPLYVILGLHDKSGDIMHEWSFRAGLDHWACFFGMLCAYNYPHFENLMKYLDSRSPDSKEALKKCSIRAGLALVSVVAGLVWHHSFMGMDKYTYNSFHPYTSVIPVLCFIVLRNIHPVLRSYHISLFAWLGKITLETYLSQLHIYLLANARTLLVLIPNFPMLNFALVTIIYLAISHRLFAITTDCSNFLLPPDRDRRRTMRNIGGVVILLLAAVPLAFGVRIL